MKPEFWAILTSAAWGIGSFFEKKGLKLGHVPPIVGITIRTFVALFLLGIWAFLTLDLESLRQMQLNFKVKTLLVLGGGLVAGTIGMLSFYQAIKGGHLPTMTAIAFTAPVWATLMAIIVGGESLNVKQIVGLIMAISGTILLILK